MNKNLYLFFLLIVAAYISSCNLNTSKTDDFDVSKYSDEDFDHLGITNRDSLSAASKRALKWPHIGNEWFIEFQVSDLKGDFDSHKVHDPCILPYRGKYYLYYKGEQMGEEITFGGRQIRHGVAIADDPKGPYIKSPFNPISNSGHEICVWPYNGGIASLITTDGPEKNTIQWSPDGINFEIMSVIKGAPHAIGLNRSADNEKEPTEILRWGLTHEYKNSDYQYIRRFESHRVTRHAAKGEKAN